MIVLDPDRLSSLHDDEIDALAAARECVVAVAAGSIGGWGAVALMLADHAAIVESGIVVVDSPLVWAGIVWRMGDRALQLALGERRPLSITARDARDRGLIDEVIRGEWREWLDGWLAHRSTAALDSAAVLTGRRGGDALERAEFARLFATGEPQQGMEAFLGKRKPRFT